MAEWTEMMEDHVGDGGDGPSHGTGRHGTAATAAASPAVDDDASFAASPSAVLPDWPCATYVEPAAIPGPSACAAAAVPAPGSVSASPDSVPGGASSSTGPGFGSTICFG
ncbi:hypothetical protein ZIOFF_029362 [Zingiber officinale]|uniref:Uncharacterized protein n=1 Tax=Zingiber officinale TaxID=94328 RepID=A0A8J5LG23_ZINOF|nr:hypothetical protein ZIOFF_029362 [Zingiber officinale]